jgi:hypothetical protein
MSKVSDCSKCDKTYDLCTKEQINECLKGSECKYCDYQLYNYPYGPNESRHCRNCGAEWSVWK